MVRSSPPVQKCGALNGLTQLHGRPLVWKSGAPSFSKSVHPCSVNPHSSNTQARWIFHRPSLKLYIQNWRFPIGHFSSVTQSCFSARTELAVGLLQLQEWQATTMQWSSSAVLRSRRPWHGCLEGGRPRRGAPLVDWRGQEHECAYEIWWQLGGFRRHFAMLKICSTQEAGSH